MIGNDIVDLAFAKEESNWKRTRYLDKLFTQKEQRYIHESQQPERVVWLLWSMKESAYKLHVQVYGNRFFAPKKFACTVFDLSEKESKGKVLYVDFKCFTQSYFTNQFVHTISKLERKENLLSQVFMVESMDYTTQHSEVYNKTKSKFSKHWGVPIDQISICKNDLGVPFLKAKELKDHFSVSLSHHGNYGAFAIKIFSELNPMKA